MSIVSATNRSTWSKGRVRYIITELRVHKCLELKSKLFPPDFTGMPPSNNTQTYTQVFLGANKEQLNSSGVVLPQGVFKPLSAERTRPDQVPQLGVKTCSEICSSWTSSPHVAQRGDVVYVERYNHDWKEERVKWINGFKRTGSSSVTYPRLPLRSWTEKSFNISREISHPGLLCSTWKRCTWTSPGLQCPSCQTGTDILATSHQTDLSGK